MFVRALPANPTLSERFDWLRRMLNWALGFEFRRRGIGPAMELAIALRMGGLARRLNAALVRWYAGTLRGPRGRAARTGAETTPHSPSPSSGEGKTCAWSILPRGFGWMRRLLPGAGGEMAAFSSLLEDAEMRAVVAAAPQVGRILRPLGHMFGLEMPADLRLPQRKRVRRSALRLAQADEAELARLTARFPDTPPARSAKRALRRMFAGLPVDVKKLSAVAYGYYVHPPRDANCPPPEIGYGGRVFGPLPKDYEWPND